MPRFRRAVRRRVQRARDVERFVQRIVAGGLALVAGLWIATLTPLWSSVWLLGAGLVLLGIAGLGAGICSEIAY